MNSARPIPQSNHQGNQLPTLMPQVAWYVRASHLTCCCCSSESKIELYRLSFFQHQGRCAPWRCFISKKCCFLVATTGVVGDRKRSNTKVRTSNTWYENIRTHYMHTSNSHGPGSWSCLIRYYPWRIGTMTLASPLDFPGHRPWITCKTYTVTGESKTKKHQPTTKIHKSQCRGAFCWHINYGKFFCYWTKSHRPWCHFLPLLQALMLTWKVRISAVKYPSCISCSFWSAWLREKARKRRQHPTPEKAGVAAVASVFAIVAIYSEEQKDTEGIVGTSTSGKLT